MLGVDLSDQAHQLESDLESQSESADPGSTHLKFHQHDHPDEIMSLSVK